MKSCGACYTSACPFLKLVGRLYFFGEKLNFVWKMDTSCKMLKDFHNNYEGNVGVYDAFFEAHLICVVLS